MRRRERALLFAGVAAVGSASAVTVALDAAPAREARASAVACPGKVGQAVRLLDEVHVRGELISPNTPVANGDWMKTDDDGFARLCLKKGSTTCDIGGGTLLRIGPPKKGKKRKDKRILLFVSRAESALTCETSSGSMKVIATPGRIVRVKDPLFSITVGKRRMVVKVQRGAAVVARTNALHRGVTLGRSKRVVVPAGRDPLKPTTFALAALPARERQSFQALGQIAGADTDKKPPPPVRIVSGPRPLTPSRLAVFRFAAEPGLTLSCALDGLDFRFCTPEQRYESLIPGRHTLLVRATDEAGNTGDARSHSWTIHRRASSPIVFESDRDGNWEIYAIAPDGTGERRLTESDAVEVDAAWSLDGAKLVFESARDREGPSEIYVMNADGSAPTRLTANPANDRNPKWSPLATQIAFESDRDGGNVELYVMDARGRNQTRLTVNGARDSDPSWSPDGKRLAFESNRHGNDEIYVLDLERGGAVRLTTNPAGETNAAWSPDGTKIAFESDRDGNHELYVMNADGSDQVRLTDNAARDSDPAWSPDGRRIAFASDRDGDFEIYVMDSDGGRVTRLTHSRGDDLVPGW